MTNIEEGTHPGTEAARALERDAGHLIHLGLDLALAALAGTLLARTLRRRALHWSWALAALPPCLAIEPLLPSATTWTVTALTVAALRGRRMHREDIDTGVDLARLARSRRTPLAGASRVLSARASSLARDAATLATRPGSRGDVLLLARDRDGRAVRVPFDPRGGGHTLVVGATGSGKTVTQALIAERAIAQGRGAIVIDPKGDRGLRDRLTRAADAAGREFVEWTPSGPTVYNPYARGSETEIADRLLAGERFTEPHYMRQAQRYLGHAVRALRARGDVVSLAAVADALEPDALERLLRDVPGEQAAGGFAYLDSLTARQQRDLSGVRDRLAILAESDAGRWLDPRSCRDGAFDLLAAARERAVVYLSLESDSRPLLAQMLGAAIVQDLQSAVASLQADPVPTLVLIDEFSAVAAEHVVALFGRARSAGFSLLLGTQEIADLRLPGRERLLEQVMGNLSMLVAHRQVVPASADLLARLGGQRGTWRVSWSSTGRRTRTRTQEPVLAPELLMELAPGWAAILPLATPGPARFGHVIAQPGARR